MNYLLLGVTAFIFMFQTISFKEFNLKYMKNIASYFLFNFIYFSLTVLILWILSGGIKSLNPYTLWMGISFGIVFIGAIFSYMKAMELGPLSYSALFNSFGLLIPIIFGLFFWNEKIKLIQLSGLLLLLATFYLGNEPNEDGDKKQSGLWFVFCFFAFIGNGALMVISKGQQVLVIGEEVYEFLIIAFGTAAIISLLLFCWNHLYRKQEIEHFKSWSFAWVSIIAAISTAIGNWLMLLLTTRVPSVVQFPTINGGMVFLSTLASSIIFKEKLSKKAMLGLLIGLMALVLLSL
ncbi:MAG TPA: EamA family transporter [Clostridia bacterium]|nr:EamA family transporter [Clostridia bacterium]